ncbi:hypothetical protein [Hymenobacter cellulosivorans]|uniref:DUF4177 domain-containing protein n=1 Tax=Hymenobacter cellulosivorans TaxID=2932249 RepID=A0ABY4F9M9_9BACT|nr:hypothetical protein [Hymenobacter cellulosivorans]UOQ53218.1 hypothetical protein MUN80_00305 [Hymenobacter cellulosivorans]
MRNITCLLGLLLASGAALAQRQPTPSRYLMLVRVIDISVPGSELGRSSSLTTIQPDGTFSTEEVQVLPITSISKKTANASIARFTPDSTSNNIRRQRYAQNTVYQAEVKKLNELSAQGWQLVSTTQEAATVRYLFRKDAAVTQ